MHKDFKLPAGVGYVWICGVPTSDPSGGVDDKRHQPSPDFPILQSYVDTILVGALRYASAGVGHADGMHFAAALVQSIGGWDAPWMNDRIMPGRPWSWRPEYALIDGLLSSCPASAGAFRNRMLPFGAPSEGWAQVQRKEHQKWTEWRVDYFGEADISNRHGNMQMVPRCGNEDGL